MRTLIIQRLVGLVPLLLLFSLLVFTLIHLAPGDPATFFMPAQVDDPSAHDRIVAQLGLDKPLYVQYVLWLGGLLHLDLGFSWAYGQPVLEVIAQRFGASAQLWLVTMLVALMVSIPVGILSAVRRNSWFDTSTTFASFLGISMPDFWLAL